MSRRKPFSFLEFTQWAQPERKRQKSKPTEGETSKKAGRTKRGRRQQALIDLNDEGSPNDAMRHRLPGSFESGKRR